MARDMFKAAEAGATMPDDEFRRLTDRLRLDLVMLQQQAREAGVPILIVLSGIKGAGVVDTLNLLNTWMDPRWIATTAFDAPTDEECARPAFWRYWRALPAAGHIGLFPGGWYADAMAAVCAGDLSRTQFADQMTRVRAFEHTLAAEGALILKFWIHISERAQKKLAPVQARDPLVGLRASDNTWSTPDDYRTYVNAARLALSATHAPATPWFVVDGRDDNHRRATVLSTLAGYLKGHLRRRVGVKTEDTAFRPGKDLLARIDLTPSLSDKAYKKEFHREQVRLHKAQARARAAGIATVVVFEGWDAAGKGGAIRRLTYALNARDYRVIPTAAPTDEERAHHYLWRFWRNLGPDGDMTVFDRSWYGRVLVERTEKLIPKKTWRRAYGEIKAFERDLTDHGSVVVKFWLHISKQEQKKRFKERAETPYKKWKLTADDWRNRKKWSAYEKAANDMFAHTSTPRAPWHVIAANDKHYARVAVLRAVSTAIERALRDRPATSNARK